MNVIFAVKISIAIAFMTIFYLPSPSLHAEVPNELLQSLRTKYEEEKTALRSVHATRITRTGGDKSEFLQSVEIKTNGSMILNIDNQPIGQERVQKKRVWGSNSKYTFRVGQKDPDWVLAELALEPNANTIELTKGIPILESSIAVLLPHRSLFGLPLHKVLDDRLEKTSVQYDANNVLQKIAYTVGQADLGYAKQLGVISGSITFDSNIPWCIKEMDEVVDSRGSGFVRTITFKYTTVGDKRILTEQHIRIHFTNSKEPQNDSIIINTFDIQPCAPIPESEFSLSAFGLPEPPGFEVKKSTPSYVWWIVGGTLAFGVSLLLRRIVRKKKT